MKDAPSLHEYFNRLEAVQQIVTELMASRDLVTHHVGNGAQVLGSLFTGKTGDRVKHDAYMDEAQKICNDTRRAATQYMSRVTEAVVTHSLLNINLPTLEIQPELVTRENYAALADILAMLDKDGPSIKKDLAKLRRDAEMALVEKARLVKTGQLRNVLAG